MISAKRSKKRVTRRQGVMIAAAKQKPAAKPKALAKKELNSFLALHVGEATDAYLRGLVMNQTK